jgi:aspartyl protease family protein
MNRRYCLASIILGLCFSTSAAAVDVNLVGLFPNKALVQIDGGPLRTLSVGDKTRDDVLLLSVNREGATFQIQGRQATLTVGPARKQSGQAVASAGNYPGGAANYPAAANYATVPTNDQGDMVADGDVNGVAVRFVVDTGATLVTLSASDAARFGIDYRQGKKVIMETANGEAFAYQVKLDTVRVGRLTVRDVDAVVAEGSALQVALLGMSFLNRVDMRREGTVLTLTKR